jgi:hypothetical protein
MTNVNVHSRRGRGEAGVSLIELLIAISITTIILVPIGMAIYFGFQATGTTQTRIQETDSANVLASYFVPDVQGSVAIAKGASDGVACGGAGQTANIVITTLASPTTTVSYYRGTGANASVLYRRTCSNGAVTATARVLRNISGDPSFTCDLAVDCSAFRSVSLSVLQANAAAKEQYQTRLTASKRGS